MRDTLAVIKRTLVSFYDDQMTHHAAALTYYALMSLFPTVLFALSLLGLVGQYPETYDAIMGYARDVAPDSVVTPLDSSLQQALQNKGTATTTLAISAVIAFYGTTGVLEAARRALNVVFEIENGRSFLRRKLVDVASTIILITLALVTGVLVFVGGGFADDLFDFIGLGQTAADIWKTARWPAALLVAMLVFSYVYYITPDVQQRSWRWVTPGAVVGVLLWLVGVVGLLDLHLPGVRRRRHLRRLHGRDPARGVAVADERRAAVRRGAQRRDRAPAGAEGRRALTPHAEPAGPPGLAGDVLEDEAGDLVRLLHAADVGGGAQRLEPR